MGMRSQSGIDWTFSGNFIRPRYPFDLIDRSCRRSACASNHIFDSGNAFRISNEPSVSLGCYAVRSPAGNRRRPCHIAE